MKDTSARFNAGLGIKSWDRYVFEKNGWQELPHSVEVGEWGCERQMFDVRQGMCLSRFRVERRHERLAGKEPPPYSLQMY